MRRALVVAAIGAIPSACGASRDRAPSDGSDGSHASYGSHGPAPTATPPVTGDASADRGKPSDVRLPPEVIQKIVRANFGKFRKCYENGLRTSPNLQGSVTVKFVIGLDGRVTSAADEKSDYDPAVIACVVDEFRTLHFPKPEGGIVTVVYPIIFNPGD